MLEIHLPNSKEKPSFLDGKMFFMADEEKVISLLNTIPFFQINDKEVLNDLVSLMNVVDARKRALHNFSLYIKKLGWECVSIDWNVPHRINLLVIMLEILKWKFPQWETTIDGVYDHTHKKEIGDMIPTFMELKVYDAPFLINFLDYLKSPSIWKKVLSCDSPEAVENHHIFKTICFYLQNINLIETNIHEQQKLMTLVNSQSIESSLSLNKKIIL